MRDAIAIVERELGHLRSESGDAVGLGAIEMVGRYAEATRILKLLREGCKWP